MRGLGMIGRSGMLALASMAGLTSSIPPSPEPLRRRRRYASTIYGGGRTRTTYQKQHGERECARRRRQIAAGSLTEANGLVR
jgi:urease alpha subunit